MSSVEGLPVIQYFADISGKSLDDGFVYIGTSGLDPVANPISVFWDAALTIPAPNPIRTRNGHPDRSGVPARFFVDTDSYSFAVKNKNGTTVYTALDSLSASDVERRIRNDNDIAKGAGIVGFSRGIPSDGKTVYRILNSQSVNILEFTNLVTSRPSPSDPSTWDWRPAFQAAMNSGSNIEVRDIGFNYFISDYLVPVANQTIFGDGVITTNNPTKTVIRVQNDNIYFYGVTLTQSYTGPTYDLSMVPVVLDFAASDNITFDNVTIRDSGYFGILAELGGNVWRVFNSRIIMTGRDGVDIRGGYGHVLQNNTCIDTGDDALVITNRRYDPGSGFVTESAEDFTISDNMIIRPGSINLGGSGIRVGGVRGIIANNTIRQPNRYGIAISCLDADASVRPDDIICIGNNIYELSSVTSDASAFLCRDVDNVQIIGGTLDCQGAHVSATGNAIYLRNNTTNPIAAPENKHVLLRDVRIVGADKIFHQTVFNTRHIEVVGGFWENCNTPFLLAQNPAFTMRKIEFKGITIREPLSYAIFQRNNLEAGVTYFEADDITVESAITPAFPPFLFGDPGEVGAVARARIVNSNFNAAPVFGKNPVTTMEHDYDHFYRLVGQSPATITAGNTSVTVSHNLDLAPLQTWIQFAVRTPVAVGLTTITSTELTFSIAASLGVSTIIDWTCDPRIGRYRNGTLS